MLKLTMPLRLLMQRLWKLKFLMHLDPTVLLQGICPTDPKLLSSLPV